MLAYIVVDLGFGDAGKGLLTDFLIRLHGGGVVVRYNGGAQAGHNVVEPGGLHHTFSQFGSGTFVPGTRTYLSRHVVIHPAALLVEGDILQGKGIRDAYARLRISDQALVITPFHQAANRIRELVRGPERHGSCGIGIGEAVEDAQNFSTESVLAGDLIQPDTLCRKLKQIRDRKREQMKHLFNGHSPESHILREFSIFERKDIIDTWMGYIGRIGELGLVGDDSVLRDWLGEAKTAVFEGAQGVLLDGEAGFHPYTTWSDCTSKNALDLIHELAPASQTVRLGIMRSHMVRHGPGPLPTETDELNGIISEHNQPGEWQGPVRYGWFDAVLTRYAMKIAGRLDGLAVTHMDILRCLNTWKYCPGYANHPELDPLLIDCEISKGILKNFHPKPSLYLEQRTDLTKAFFYFKPVLETCSIDEKMVVDRIESLLGQPVNIISRGPSARDVQFLKSILT